MSDALEALKQRRRLAQLSTPAPSATVSSKPEMEPIATKTVKCQAWICDLCNKECIPIRSESRCLCGHRQREHDKHDLAASKCSRCPCASFFYIVAEGSWVLHCRCKHKHTDHEPNSKRCTKPKCDCSAFDSPWVCNCNHAWSDHQQVVIEREIRNLAAMIAPEVNRWDEVRRGVEEEGL